MSLEARPGSVESSANQQDSVSQIQQQIQAHEIADKHQSLLHSGLSAIWDGGAGKSLEHLKQIQDEIAQARSRGDLATVQADEKQAAEAAAADQKKLQSRDTILGYASGALEMAAMALKGGPLLARCGLLATGVLYGLDNAKSGEGLNDQLIDGALGATKGIGLRGLFQYAGSSNWNPIQQGVVTGFVSRFADAATNRDLYRQNGLEGGLSAAVGQAADWRALAIDGFAFGAGSKLFSATNSALGNRLEQSSIARSMFAAGSLGFTDGTSREILRQHDAHESFDLGKVLGHGLTQASLNSVAGLAGEIRSGARPLAAENHAVNSAERASEAVPVNAIEPKSAATPQEFVVTSGADRLRDMISSVRAGNGQLNSALIEVQTVLGANALSNPQRMLVQHVASEADVPRVQAFAAAEPNSLVATCFPKFVEGLGAKPVVTGAEQVQLHTRDGNGQFRLAFTPEGGIVKGFEPSITLGDKVSGSAAAAENKPQEYVVVGGQAELKQMINALRAGQDDPRSAMIQVRKVLGDAALSDPQRMLVQHVTSKNDIGAARQFAESDPNGLLAMCFPRWATDLRSQHVLPYEDHISMHTRNQDGEMRVAFAPEKARVEGFEPALVLGENSGHAAQAYLLRSILKPVAPEQAGTELGQLRQSIQNEINSGKWSLIQTGEGSAADAVGMDYILKNNKDGRYFFFDTTLDLRAKQGVSPLRQESIIPLQLQPGEFRAVTEETQLNFAKRIQQAMHGDTILNANEIPLPSFKPSPTPEHRLQQIQSFRSRVGRISRNAQNGDYGTEVNPEKAALLDGYRRDMGKAESYARHEAMRAQDPNRERYLSSIHGTIDDTARSVVLDAIKNYRGRLPQSEYAQSTNSLIADVQHDRMIVNSSSEQYRVEGVSLRVMRAVDNTVLSTSGIDPSLKRFLLSDSGIKWVRSRVLNQMGEMDVDQMIGETRGTPYPRANEVGPQRVPMQQGTERGRIGHPWMRRGNDRIDSRDYEPRRVLAAQPA